MTFTEYAHSRGLVPGRAEIYEAARDAWDAALCAVQDQMFGRAGQIAPPEEIAASISRLHTWAAPEPQ